MDQKDLLSAATADLRSALAIVSGSNVQLGSQIEEALGHLLGERIDAFAARIILQNLERKMLQTEKLQECSPSDRLLHILRAAEQKLTAVLSASHYSEG